MMTEVGQRPGVQPHWLFHFPVADLGIAADAIRAARGGVLGRFTLPTGEQLAVCEDAQGAAFAVWQAAPRGRR
jgi:predicted enzyme related to lactoylglutathione lyase